MTRNSQRNFTFCKKFKHPLLRKTTATTPTPKKQNKTKQKIKIFLGKVKLFMIVRTNIFPKRKQHVTLV